VSYLPGTFAIAVSGAAVFAVCTAASSLGIRWVVDHVVVQRFEHGAVATSTVIAGCVLLVGIALVRAAGVVVRRTYAGKTEWGVAEQIANSVAQRYADQPAAWHRSHVAGDLVARASVDTDASVNVLAPLPYGSSVMLLLVISALGMAVVDPVLGAVALVVLPVLVAINIGYQHRVDGYFQTAQQELGLLAENVLESFEGVAVVKSFAAEQRETDRLAAITARLRDARIKAVKARATFEMMLDTVPSLSNLLLLALGAYRVRSGDITVGDLAAAMYLFTLLVLPLRLIGYVFSEVPHSAAGWTRVREILDEPLIIDPRAAIGQTDDDSAISLTAVSLGYTNQELLKNVNISVRRGTVVALVGPTGAGKSTLMKAIAGLEPVLEGKIQVAKGGTSLVFQEPFVFSESVRFNLDLGRAVPDDVIGRAIHDADADFLYELSHGLESSLGERGVSLSGGQRQRLALARALVRQSPVLLLDDTTSALDPGTELRVLGNLRNSNLVDTVLLVAARPATIAYADEVVFISTDGRVVQSTHELLLVAEPGYRDIINAFSDDRREGVSS
jgi:ABC-type multidrug transport system fused ATPase/permease subunit